MSLTLRDLQSLCETARLMFRTTNLIIAGGAPRDIFSGATVKDIDVFVMADKTPGDDTPFARGCRELAAFLGGAIELVEGEGDYAEVFDICNITGAHLHPEIQIIGIDRDPVDDVHRYDFGLSQVFVSPRGQFFTEAAVRDFENYTITYTPSNPDAFSVERSRKRLARLKAKYPGWHFANCEVLK